QIERDRELILALRLLYHPRLVYLVTGYIDNLEHALTLEFLRRMMKSGLSRDKDLEDDAKVRARILSNSITRKVFPYSHVLDIGKLTISQLLEWDKKTSKSVLERIKIRYKPFQDKDDNTLYKFLEKRSKAKDFNFSCILFRDLQQFQDRYMETINFSMKSLADFLSMLRSEGEDPDEFIVIYGGDPIVLYTYPGSIFPLARLAHQPLASSPSIEVRVGVNLEFHQERIAGELFGGKKTRFVQASPLTLLALDLAAESPHVHVHQHTPKIRPSQCMAWSIFSASSDVWLPWPSIEANSPTQLAERGESWAEAVSKLAIHRGMEWVDRIAFTWIRLHLLWIGAKPDQLPAALESNTVMEKAWSELVACFSSI